MSWRSLSGYGSCFLIGPASRSQLLGVLDIAKHHSRIDICMLSETKKKKTNVNQSKLNKTTPHVHESYASRR